MCPPTHPLRIVLSNQNVSKYIRKISINSRCQREQVGGGKVIQAKVHPAALVHQVIEIVGEPKEVANQISREEILARAGRILLAVENQTKIITNQSL